MEDDPDQFEEWDYNTCKEEDLRYLDEDVLISSDETAVDETDNIYKRRPKKFNQLNPKAKSIYRLIKLIKPAAKSIWKTEKVLHSSVLCEKRNLNCDMYIDNPNTMESSKLKRKRESFNDEELQKTKKKSKRSKGDVKVTEKIVNRKEQVHSMSSSESENGFNTSPEGAKTLDHHKKSYGHLLSSEEEGNGSFSKNRKNSSEKNKATKKLAKLNHNTKKFNHSLSDVEYSSERSISTQGSLPSLKKKRSDQQSEGNEREINGLSHSRLHGLKKIKKELDYSDEFSDNRSDVEDEPQEQHKQAKSYPKLTLTRHEEKALAKFALLLDKGLTAKNNVWILQCPDSLDCADLVGQRLNFSDKGSSRLEVGSSMFEAYSYRDHSGRSTTLAVPSSSNQLNLCRIPLAGNIIVEESVDVKNIKSFKVPEPPQCVELPQNLRTRHPLLGLDYERQTPFSSCNEDRKSSKKKKHSRSYNKEEYELDTALGEVEVDKKKKDTQW